MQTAAARAAGAPNAKDLVASQQRGKGAIVGAVVFVATAAAFAAAWFAHLIPHH
jgi:hypothetical protein